MGVMLGSRWWLFVVCFFSWLPWRASASIEPIPVPWKGDKLWQPTNRKHNWCKLASLQNYDNKFSLIKGSTVSVLFANNLDKGTLVNCKLDDESGNVTGGLMVEIWKEVAARADLAWTSSFAVYTGLDPTNKSESWDQVFQWGTDNYDLVATWVTMTPDRMAAQLRFAYPFLDVSSILVGFVSRAEPAWYEVMFSFLRPFKWTVWLCLAVSFLLGGLVYRRLEKGQDDIPDETFKDGTSYRTALYLTAANFTAGGGAYMPKTMTGRVFSLAFNFGLLMIVGAYTANLASLLVVKSSTYMPVTSIEDAIVKGVPVCLNLKSPQGRWLVDQYPNLKLVSAPSSGEVLRGILTDQCGAAVIAKNEWQLSRARSRLNPGCQLGQIGEPLRAFSASFVVRADEGFLCTSFIADYVSMMLQKMTIDGTIGNMVDQSFAKFSDQNCGMQKVEEKEEEEGGSLGLRDVSGIFLIQAVAAVCCLFVYYLVRGFRESPKRLLMLESESSETDG